MAAIEKICPEARNLLIIPDNEERSTFYLSNLAQLRDIFYMAGLNVRIGSISPKHKKTTTIELPDGHSITIDPVVRVNGRVGVKDFDPCTILLNNDLFSGIPGILEDLHTQHLLPPLHASHAVRRKSNHSECYDEVAKRFGKLIGVDPWLINPLFEATGEVDLSLPNGRAQLKAQIESLLSKIRRKYKEYGIKEKPFVLLKSDSGNHQTGLFTVRDANEVDNACAAGLSGTQMLLLQEGMSTQERLNGAIAEPVVYMMDRYVVGGFYRVHAQQGVDHNLSVPGASYVPLAFADTIHLPQLGMRAGDSAPNRFYMYGVIARLAMLAASYELEATDPDAALYQ